MSNRGSTQEIADTMASAELATLVDQGWAELTIAQQILSTLNDASGSLASAVDLGRRLVSLATEFKRCGQPIPARLIQNLAEAFTHLGRQNLTRSDQDLEILRTAIGRFGDLLVQLDATGEINAAEPIDTRIPWEASVTQQTIVPPVATHSEPELSGSRSNSWGKLYRCGNALFEASESLLNRIQRDNCSPYSAPVSSIHHLASALREQLIEIDTTRYATSDPAVGDPTLPESPRVGGISRETTISDFTSSISLRNTVATDCDVLNAVPAWLPTGFTRRVLVIDDSPFFRMLLGTAIESVGYLALTLASLDEAVMPLNESQASDIVIWGGIDSPTLTDCLTEWIMRRDDSRRPMLIGLANGMDQSIEVPSEFNHVVLRTQLPELLNLIRDSRSRSPHHA